MSTSVLSVRLPDDLKGRLDASSSSSGRTTAYDVREAVAKHLGYRVIPDFADPKS